MTTMTRINFKQPAGPAAGFLGELHVLVAHEDARSTRESLERIGCEVGDISEVAAP